jgi:hypothetical protein
MPDSIIICTHTRYEPALYLHRMVFCHISLQTLKSSKNEENVKFNENHQFLILKSF